MVDREYAFRAADELESQMEQVLDGVDLTDEQVADGIVDAAILEQVAVENPALADEINEVESNKLMGHALGLDSIDPDDDDDDF